MKKKLALAFAGLMIIMMATSLAPIANAQPPPMGHYVVTRGQLTADVILHLGPLPIGPLSLPYQTRDPWMTPLCMWQDIVFTPVGGPIVILTIPWTSIVSMQHVFFGTTLGYTRVTLLPVPGKNGQGWLYLAPVADVDIHVINTNMTNPQPPPTYIPIAIWAPPSPKVGQAAANPGLPTYPFPWIGADQLPGFCPGGPGTQDDGFGDGVPDPAGSAVVFLPMQLYVEAWNGTAWEFQFGGPFILPLTTGLAVDTVMAPWSPLHGVSLAFAGVPFDPLFKTVTFAWAWSFIQYFLSAGPPVVMIDLVYGGYETKVIDPGGNPAIAAADIDGDGTVTVLDIRKVAKIFGLYDEQLGRPVADAGWDARCDLNNDGYIDIFDLRKVAKNYGLSP